jgi:hypothetical protein
MAINLLYSGSRFWPGEELAAILDSHPRRMADVLDSFFTALEEIFCSANLA